MPPVRTRPSNHAHSKSTTGGLNKKIRDIERLLEKKTDLPATIRLEKERELQAFHHELRLANQSQHEQKMSKKYHMVRFFERQKATRRLKKVQRELAAVEGEPPEDLKRKAHEAEVELNYVLYYPRSEKYISLFKDPGNDSKVVGKRNTIKKDIERRMAKGTLGSVTADSTANGEEGGPAQRSRPKKAKERKKDKQKAEEVDEQTMENDDFFEF